MKSSPCLEVVDPEVGEGLETWTSSDILRLLFLYYHHDLLFIGPLTSLSPASLLILFDSTFFYTGRMSSIPTCSLLWPLDQYL